MDKPLPEPCPRVPQVSEIAGERCGHRKILEDNRLHQCFLKVTHNNKHACWCGQDWPPLR
jgi:hypothetical protein